MGVENEKLLRGLDPKLRAMLPGLIVIHEFTRDRGNKRIELRIHQDFSAQTYISTLDPRTHRRQDGATTELYRLARDEMVNFATQAGRPIDYTLSTSYLSIKAWAKSKTKGSDIFKWESQNNPNFIKMFFGRFLGFQAYKARTTIYPIGQDKT